MSSVQLIYDALKNLLYPYGDNFRQAEAHLAYLGAQPEFIVHLLELTVDESIDLPVKRLGAVFLKNKISRSWSSRAADQISDGDKHIFRPMIIQAIISCHPSLQEFLIICLARIMEADLLKGSWPELLPKVEYHLSHTESIPNVMGGLKILKQVCKFYRWNMVRVNQQLNPLMSDLYPTVLGIAEAAVNALQTASDNDALNDVYYGILYETFKIYKLSTARFLPEICREEEYATRTIGMFLHVFMLPLPALVLSTNPTSERNALISVKCQKWATGNIVRTHNSYLTKAYSNVSENAAAYAPYRQKFLQQFSPEISKLFIQRLQAWSQKKTWLSDSVIYNIVTYLAAMIEYKHVFVNIIEPQFKGILGEVMFPLMCPTEDELDLFEDDPIEFIQRQDDLNIRLTPSQVATDFIGRVVRKRKPTLDLVIEFLQQCANKLADQPESWKERVGLMKLLKALEHLFLGNKTPWKDLMDALMTTFVIPALASPNAYLRNEACNTIGVLCNFKYNARESLQQTFQGVLNCFFDAQNLPGQVSAALTLQALAGVEQNQDIRAVLKIHITEIIRNLLILTQKIDHEALLGVLDFFVEQFPEQITPFAVELAAQMCQQFIGVASELAEVQRQIDEAGGGLVAESDVMEISNEKTNTGFGIMNFLANLQNNLEHQKDLTVKLDAVIAPVFHAVYQHKLIDFYADCLSLHENTLVALKSVPLHHWQFFELLILLLQNTKFEYLEDAMPVLESYITYGSGFLAQNPAMLSTFVDLLVTFYIPSNESASVKEPTAIFSQARTRAHIMTLATKLLVSNNLLNGGLGPHVRTMIDAVIARVGADAQSGSNAFPTRYNVATVSVVLGGLYHDTKTSLAVLDNRLAVDAFLTTWSGTLTEFTRVNDLKLSILATLSLLTYQATVSPFPIETQEMIWKILIRCLETIPGAASRAVEIMKEDELGWNYDEEDYDGFDIDYDEDENDDEEDEFGADASAEFGDQMPESSAVTGKGDGAFMYEQPGPSSALTTDSSENKGYTGEDIEPSAKDSIQSQVAFLEDDFAEDVYSVSPLDAINPYDAMRTVFQSIQAIRPDFYLNSINSLSEADKGILDESIQRKSLPTYTRATNKLE